jgi:hypothetical protein
MNKYITLILTFFCSVQLSAQTFVNEQDSRGVDAPVSYSIMGEGASFYDFNQDGWDDLSFCQTDVPPVFYENQEGTFIEVDLGIPGDGEIKHLTWVDFDNDGDPDIFYSMKDGPCRLFENDGNLTFTDISNLSPWPDDTTHHVNGVCWGDYDKDGLLDVYLSHFNDQFYPIQYTNWLMKNLGGGVFENVTVEAGVGNGASRTFQASFLDYNNDGWPDIHVINDRWLYYNALYKNNGDGTFEDVSQSTGADLLIDAMSTSIADYDNDEDLDIYVANGVQGNHMLNNQGGSFADSTSATGLVVNGVCWSANWADFDNDGWQDVHVCTMDNGETESWNHAYMNNGGGSFTEVTYSHFPENIMQSWSNISGDVNNDGYVDLVSSSFQTQTTPVWINEATAGNNFVKVSLIGTDSNLEAIGSWIKVYTGDLVQSRYTASGEDYLCQDSQREIIGLGQAAVIDSISITWPTGITETITDFGVNQTYVFVEGQIENDCPADFNQSGTINAEDLLILLTEFGCLSNCLHDLTFDGMVNSSDMLEFLTYFGGTCE